MQTYHLCQKKMFYRHDSLTSVSCKLLEHIICKHLLDNLEKNKILTNLNHGFGAGYSCETQLLTTFFLFLATGTIVRDHYARECKKFEEKNEKKNLSAVF